jgi:hypothetical protein
MVLVWVGTLSCNATSTKRFTDITTTYMYGCTMIQTAEYESSRMKVAVLLPAQRRSSSVTGYSAASS